MKRTRTCLHRITSWFFLIMLVAGMMYASRDSISGAMAFTPPAIRTYYVTLPEDIMLQYLREDFTAGTTSVSPLRSIISIAIGTNNTVVYYDQWEDGGYETDISIPGSNIFNAATNPDGTQIWGDGVLANGCVPLVNNTINPCTSPTDDRLQRGQTITLDSYVVVDGALNSYYRDPAKIFYDGRDKIGASLPVAIARAIWPSGAGSLIADAQGILPTERWGMQYVSPVGENNNGFSDAYDDVRMLVMAGAGGATINVDANADGDYTDTFDRNNHALTEGQVLSVAGLPATTPDGVLAGASVDVVSGNPVQVTLITSDVGSTYENRFYNLVPRSDWVTNYYSPVGTPTTVGTLRSCTSNWIYNPNATALTVSYDFYGGASPNGTFSVPARSAVDSPLVPSGSGVHFYTTDGRVFLPISMTDCTNGATTNGNGNIFDWGHELYPVKQLSPEVLVGWTPGCTDESYQGVCLDATDTSRTTSRTVVWVMPLANTDIYVDTNGSGIACPGGIGAEQTINAEALRSYTINNDPSSRTYVHDNFGTVAYNRVSDNIGFGLTPATWATNWQETNDDGSAASGAIWITGGSLQIRDNGGDETNVSIQRSRNLSGQYYSRTSFRIQFAGAYDSDDAIAFEISPNGGSTWVTLEEISGPISFATGQSANNVYRTSAYNSPNTTFRFRTVGNLEAGDSWSIDEVHIDNAPDGDFDMTGSYIRTCNDALIATAFGQNPAYSFSGDDEAMDLGMGIPPYGSQITITKNASATLVAPGSLVTYSYTVRLIQTFSTSVNNIEVKDDMCAPAVYQSGDTANPGFLDPGEVWNFSCTSRIYAETTNTAIAYALYGTDRILSTPAQATVKLTSSLGDLVWVDEDGDGDQDAGEPGVPNVRLTLTGTDMNSNPVSRSTYSDTNGRYVFTNVPPSDGSGYTVTVDTSTLPAGLAANPTYDEDGTGTPHITNVLLGSGLEYTTADFGYNWASTSETNSPASASTGMIGDRVWSDGNGNGQQDPGEPGLQNVSIELLTAGPDGLFGTLDDVVAASTTSDDAGNYAFDGLTAGSYVVRIPSSPSGYAQTGDPDQPGVTCTTCDSQTSTPILLAPGDVYLNADFGFLPDLVSGATIGDTLWVDTDRDDNLDAGEPGLPGVSVALIRDLNGNGYWEAGEPIIATDITDANGQYAFTGVPVTDGTGSDDYLVWINDAATVSSDLVATYDADGSNPTGGLVTGLGMSTVADLAAAGDLNQDFAYATAGHDAGEALVGDTIWLDQNGNGTFDAGEGLEGVMVNLLNDSAKIIARIMTNENGQYFFGGLPAGSYSVDVDLNSLPNYGTDLTNFVDPDGGMPNRAGFSLANGEVNLNQDFGYNTSAGYTIGGTLWMDTDVDGLLDGGESNRFAGVTVALFTDSNSSGTWDAADHLVGTQVTDGSGDFSFTGLPNSLYFVDVTDEANLLEGYWHSLGTAGADNNSQFDPYSVVLLGASNTTADFGYYRDPASLGDFIWIDTNGEGIQVGGETGMPGVEVALTITWPPGGTSSLKTITSASGYYHFGNLLLDEDFYGAGAGEPSHSISVVIPASYTPSPQNASAEASDSDNPAGEAATVAEGQTNNTYDFGLSQVDFGDLPNDYNATLLANNGGRHAIGTLTMGTNIDRESDGQPGSLSSGDDTQNLDDDDGVTRNSSQHWTNTAVVDILVDLKGTTPGGQADIGIWIDWNNNDTFDAATDFFTCLSRPVGSIATCSITIPDSGSYTLGSSVYARIRAFDPARLPGGSLDASDYQGLALNGEVEDYLWQFSPTSVSLVSFNATSSYAPSLLLLLATALLAGAFVIRRNR